MFWFEREQESWWKQKVWWWISRVHVLYFFLLFFCLSILSALAFSLSLVQGRINVDTLEKYGKEWWVYLAWIDPAFSKVLYAWQEIFDRVRKKQPLFPSSKEKLDIILDYIHNNGSWLIQPGIQKLWKTWNILQWLSKYKDDIFSLLWEEREQTYLIILQNTAEKRPNGGFFGSFAVVKIDHGRLVHFEIMDSYLPAFNKPWTSILWPQRLLNFLPERIIYFVWANKIGFSYHDGANIKTLYEKSFPGQRVRGVIFVSTDLLQTLLPSFREQQRAWQFTNAATDIIRGGDKRWKKELYIDHAKDYFLSHRTELLKWLVKKLPQLLQERYINVYLTDISWPFHGFLRREKMTTRFEKETMYFRESNISYNKVDNFVQKIIQIYDDKGKVVQETMHEIVDVASLAPWKYTVRIIYTLHVPHHYKQFIHDLEQKYEIELTPREQHILALDPEWATRGVVYMPPTMKVLSQTGDCYHFAEFDTPFAHAIYYKIKMKENNMVKEIKFDIEK